MGLLFGVFLKKQVVQGNRFEKKGGKVLQRLFNHLAKDNHFAKRISRGYLNITLFGKSCSCMVKFT
jgi:hypothetical protein